MGSESQFCVATIPRTECPLWVKSRHRSRFGQCPLYSQKRTLIKRIGMSALCQKQTYLPLQPRSVELIVRPDANHFRLRTALTANNTNNVTKPITSQST